MKNRIIETLGKNNKATLRKIFREELGLGKKASEEKIMKALDVTDKNEMYQLMALMFNEKIETDKQRLKELKDANKKEMNSLLKGLKGLEAPYTPRYKTYAIKSETSVFKSLESFEVVNNNDFLGDRSLNLIKSFTSLLHKALTKHKTFKVNINITAVYIKEIDEIKEIIERGHQIKTGRVFNKYDIGTYIDYALSELQRKIDEFEQNGSGWKFVKISKMVCNVVKFKPIKGSSYIDLPDWIKNKKCCINIKNQDNKCFKYSVLYHFHKDELKKDPQRVSKYVKYGNEFNLDSLNYPLSIQDIEKAERLINKPINIFTYPTKTAYTLGGNPDPLRNSKMEQQDDEIDLLLISEGKNNHYVYIKDFNVLVARGINSDNDYSTMHKRFFCKRCIHGFTTPTSLQKHLTDGCLTLKPTHSILPSRFENGDAPTTYFKSHYKQFKAPFVIYADFESFIKPIDQPVGCNNYNKSFTQKIQKHEPCGYSYQVVSSYDNIKFPLVLYRGSDASRHFVDSILKTEDKIMKALQTNKKMIITPKQEEEFKKATRCHFCNGKLEEDRVRDHDHITGLYRGPAHNICNLNYNDKYIQIPVFFHNLKNYDGHIIIRALSHKGFKKIKVLAQNFEKYISFQVSHLVFKDSFGFLSSSLDTLTNNLAKNGEESFKYALSDEEDPVKRKLLLQKGIYPYDYITNEKVFEETQIPSKDKFYSRLNDCDISDKDYAHAVNVWNTFNIKNIGEYHDLYLKGDVLLLADIMESFRQTAMSYYQLDPAHYLSLPNYAWDAMLKMTKIHLEQITDIDMHQMIEKGLRGGISMITHRHAEANNKYMKNYDKTKPSSYITYLDANNLYGVAMSKFLPESFLHLVEPTNEKINEILNASPTNMIGWILEVDLDYPAELHEEHNEYPLAPERMIIEDNMLSHYAESLKQEMRMSNVKVEKLVPNLKDKKAYVVHYQNLQYYIKKGMKLKNVSRIIEFKQSAWLEEYIAFNSDKRSKSKNDFEKDFFKLMNNAVFGKTMENVRNRVDIQLINNEEDFLKLVAKPTFETFQTYDDNLVAVQMRKTQTVLNKPIYVGMSVLDLSKLHMYEFHYDYIKEKYGNKARLLFTDTDSLTYHIETDDLYTDMKENKENFDFSNFKPEHFCYDDTKKAWIGLFKEEAGGVIIIEFVGLRSKMYSIKLANGKEKYTGKGIKKQALKSKIQHSDYKRCLEGKTNKDKQQLIQFNLIRSQKHQLYTYSLNKVGLSCYDDKRYLFEDGITSYSYGHKNISN